ncbi:MAG: DUF4262 domain-containing protein [Dissulfurispiraceae bacterium]
MCNAQGKCGTRSGSSSLSGAEKLLHYCIKRNGFSIVYAFEHLPNFAYSVGLEETWAHPELVIFGLDQELSHRLITDIVDLIKQGSSFADQNRANKIINNFRVMLMDVPSDIGIYSLSKADNYYGDRKFRVIQILWPDQMGRFPVDDNCDEKVRTIQPVMLRRPNLS